MGMFDNVIYKANCKRCGKPLGDFQTKDGDCVLEDLTPDKISNFYTSCDSCNAWNDFKVNKVCTVESIEQTLDGEIDYGDDDEE